jgi:glycosyltransferase involved in cell wall biosynthesis
MLSNMPKYSICVPNYNMGDTLDRALRSVLLQIDDDYEVLIVDDGSSDNSIDVLDDLTKEFGLLRVISLARDRKRKLGETRNISVREARGEYVILHVDADDLWDPYIKDFVAVFHKLEQCIGRDVLVSGQQINMARKSFLLQHGPYRNTHRAQDRDMWMRLAAVDAYIPLRHQVFRTRLARSKKISFFKAIHDSWYHMLYDMRRGTAQKEYILGCLTGVFWSPTKNFSFKMRIFRFLFILPVFIASRLDEPLPSPDNMNSHQAFVDYRERVGGDYAEIMTRHGGDPDLSFLCPEAARIFAPRRCYGD